MSKFQTHLSSFKKKFLQKIIEPSPSFYLYSVLSKVVVKQAAARGLSLYCILQFSKCLQNFFCTLGSGVQNFEEPWMCQNWSKDNSNRLRSQSKLNTFFFSFFSRCVSVANFIWEREANWTYGLKSSALVNAVCNTNTVSIQSALD